MSSATIISTFGARFSVVGWVVMAIVADTAVRDVAATINVTKRLIHFSSGIIRGHSIAGQPSVGIAINSAVIGLFRCFLRSNQVLEGPTDKESLLQDDDRCSSGRL